MVEPTESEDLGEIDRFCDAMIAIRARDRPGRGGGVEPRGLAAARCAAHHAGARRRLGPRLLRARSRSFPTGPDPDKYWPPVGPHRPGVRRPQPGLRLPAARGVRRADRRVSAPSRRTGAGLDALLAEQADGRLPVDRRRRRPRRRAGLGRAAYGDVRRRPARDTQYRIGSITKTLTAVLVLQLRDEGCSTSTTRSARTCPETSGTPTAPLRVAARARRPGMQAEPAGSWWERSPGGSVDDAGSPPTTARARSFARRRALPLHATSASACSARSSPGCGARTWWDAGRATRILEPLGMTRTSYLPRRRTRTGLQRAPYAGTLTDEPRTDTGAMAPAGQVWSTVADLARYATFLLDGPPRRAAAGDARAGVRPAVRRPWRRPRLTRTGSGFQLCRGGSGMLVGHTGSMPGFLASLLRRPRRAAPAAVAFANATVGDAVPGRGRRPARRARGAASPPWCRPWRPTDATCPTRSREIARRLALGQHGASLSRGRATRWSPAAAASRPTGARSSRRPDRRDPRLPRTARSCRSYATTTAASTTWTARRSSSPARPTTRHAPIPGGAPA